MSVDIATVASFVIESAPEHTLGMLLIRTANDDKGSTDPSLVQFELTTPARVLLFDELCHGCGGCTMICPLKAISEEERADAVADVTPDQAAGFDDALVGGADQAAPEREVAGGR